MEIKQIFRSIKTFINSEKGDRAVNSVNVLLSLIIACIGLRFTIMLGNIQGDLSKEQNVLQSKQFKFDKKTQQKEFDFEKSQAPLVIRTKMNEEDLKKIDIYDETGNLKLSHDFPKIEISTKVGHILKITPIVSHFLNTDKPYIDMTVRMYENDPLTFYDKEVIDGFLNKVVDFYPDKGIGNYYVFYLIQGTGDKNYLVITGMQRIDGNGNQVVCFDAGNLEILSTKNNIDEDYKKEYLALKKYLEENGIPIS